MTQNEPDDRRAGDAEYPDAAGYPDGTGTLDEGTNEVAAEAGEPEAIDEVGDFAIADEEDVDN